MAFFRMTVFRNEFSHGFSLLTVLQKVSLEDRAAWVDSQKDLIVQAKDMWPSKGEQNPRKTKRSTFFLGAYIGRLECETSPIGPARKNRVRWPRIL